MNVINKLIDLKIPITVIGLIAVALLSILFILFGGSENISEKDTVTLESLVSEQTVQENGEITEKDMELSEDTVIKVVVDVKGAVKKPGVFSLMSSQRVIDAIDAAEGLVENADTKNINFAQLLEDEMYIYIPLEGEEIELKHDGLETSLIKEDKIDINEADEQTLIQLTGIGPGKASEIVKYREENGPFKLIEDITKVSGIGDKTFEKIKEDIEAK